MKTTLVPFRTVRFSVPQKAIMQFLRITLDNEVAFAPEFISDDNLHATFAISFDLSKAYQRNAMILIEALMNSTEMPTT